MSITNPTSILNAFNTANTNPYDTAAVTLTSGRWYTLVTHGYSSTSGTVSSVTHDPLGTPLAFTLLSDGTTSARKQNWDAASHRTVEIWAVKPSSTTGNALIRINWSGTKSACGWSLQEWSAGVDPTNFAVQVVVNSGTAGNTASCTMAAYSATDNATYFVAANGTGTAAPGEAFTATESRTELSENDETERADHAVYYQNPHGGDTTLNATWTNNEDWAAIGVEVKAEAAAGGATWPGWYTSSKGGWF